jgi:cytochrome c-type biogenesis protein CcmH/NrfG
VSIRGVFAALFLLSAAAAQTPPAPQQERDLKIEREPPRPTAPARETAPPRAPTIPRSYALVVGIGAYQNLPADKQLRFTERDAEAIYSILISPEGGNFRAENVRKLVGSRATLANLRNELENWLPSVAKEDDRVVIYFAGHGFIFGGRGYLAPFDFNMSSPETTGYPMDSLGQVIGSKIKAKWKVMMTDSCHSGAITPETRPELLNRAVLSLDTSLFSLTASRDREQSFESEDFGGGHGVFTYYVVKGFRGEADENGDGIVTADELQEYVRRNVREASGGRQNPTSERGSYDPGMLLAYNPNGAKPGAPPPPKFGTLVFESNMDGVELFVNNRSEGLLKKGEPFRLPGLQPGIHVIKAVKMGYEPDGPREEMVYPGQESTVKIRIQIPRRRNKAASDAFEKGEELYTRGNENNYKRAEEQFRRALEIDPKYSTAALFLGRSLHALYEYEKAGEAFRKAIEIDPDYVEARWSFAGMLLDMNDVDEAIRQLNVVLRREPDHFQALYLLAQAYRSKEVFGQGIEAARKAVRLKPDVAEPYLWLAENLRLAGQFDAAKQPYEQYLRLSDFDSKLAGKLNYYVAGFLIGMGKKKRASQHDIWRDLRSLAYFGLCDSDRNLKKWDGAIQSCSLALKFDPQYELAHYAIGISYAGKFNETQRRELAAAAATHFSAMLALNDNIEEASKAKVFLARCNDVLAQL